MLVFQTPLVVLGLVAARRPQLAQAAPPPADRLRDTAAIALALPGAGSRHDVPRAAADVAAVRGLDLARRSRRAAPGESRACLGYSGRLMARAAVKAKQQAKAKAAQPAKTRARGRRRHSGGGNPNQDLFFVRLRRQQKWVYAVLAVVFAFSFVLWGRLRQQRRAEPALHRHLRRQRRQLRLEGSGPDQEGSREGLPGPRHRVRAEGRPQERDRSAQELSRDQEDGRGHVGNARRPRDVAGEHVRDAVPERTAGSADRGSERAVPARRHARLGGGPEPDLPGGLAGRAPTRTSLLYQKATSARTGTPSPTTRRRRSSVPRTRRTCSSSRRRRRTPATPRSPSTRSKRYLKVDPNAPQKKQIEKQIKALQQQSTPTVQSGSGG